MQHICDSEITCECCIVLSCGASLVMANMQCQVQKTYFHSLLLHNQWVHLWCFPNNTVSLSSSLIFSCDMFQYNIYHWTCSQIHFFFITRIVLIHVFIVILWLFSTKFHQPICITINSWGCIAICALVWICIHAIYLPLITVPWKFYLYSF